MGGRFPGGKEPGTDAGPRVSACLGREVLLLARTTAEGERVELRRQWMTQEELDTWIVWKDAETRWWEARLYRVTLIGAIAAVMAALLALAAVVQAGWH